LVDGCGHEADYVSKVDDIVRWVTTRGMVAMLDLPFNAATRCVKPGLGSMADAAYSVSFWSQVAARYKSNPLVAFDLYNEPHDISATVWRYGGAASDAGVAFKAAGMQQLYDTVRSQGATNLVFVSGTDWANTFPATAPLSGYNIVYAVHVYTCPGTPPPSCRSPAPYDPPGSLGQWVAAGARVPVMITEFGWPDRNDGTYIANMVKFAAAHGWGWTVFAWDGTTSGQFDMLADVGPGASYEPTPVGMAVIAGLLGGI
jgi:aryl-phospho-beta-D-glucosidase BglC (GH1 family)